MSRINIWYKGKLDHKLHSILSQLDYNRVRRIKNCNYAFYPNFLWGISDKSKLLKKIKLYTKKIRTHNKHIIIFIVSDCSEPLEGLEGVSIYRTSMYRESQLDYEYLLPYLWECRDEAFEYLDTKSDIPIVGFCGIASNKSRKDLILGINNNPQIQSNFIIREQFWGGKPNDRNITDEFFNNIQQSHFTICSRGAGNFSMRFYQVLSSGRIPILIDTDMVFPFENIIDWSTLIIKGENSEDVIGKLLDWWENKNIIEIQKRCRNIYETYLSHQGFSKQLKHHLNMI